MRQDVIIVHPNLMKLTEDLLSGRIRADHSISPERLAELKARKAREDARIEQLSIQVAAVIKDWLRREGVEADSVPDKIDDELMGDLSGLMEEEE